MKTPIQPIPLINLVAKGEGNYTGTVTNVIVEKSLEAGVWVLTASVALLYQLNDATGGGQGTSPQYSPANQPVHLSVPFGKTRYVTLRKELGALDGVYHLDRVAYPYGVA